MHLGDSELVGDLALALVAVEPQQQHMLLAGWELLDEWPQRRVVNDDGFTPLSLDHPLGSDDGAS